MYKSIFFIVQIIEKKSIINNKLFQYTDSSIQKIIYFYLNIFRKLLLSNFFRINLFFIKSIQKILFQLILIYIFYQIKNSVNRNIRLKILSVKI